MITAASDRALLLTFGETLASDLHLKVRALVAALRKRPDLPLREIQPAYSSVLVTFDPLQTDPDSLAETLRPVFLKIQQGGGATRRLGTRTVEIPVCYDPPLASDLPDVAAHNGIPPAEVIRLHAAAEYTVCFFGFMPGFSYWSGLPERLAVPRLATPRRKVPAGSVGIGGAQTGIYPLETPGGWRIIGRTPVSLFDPANRSPCLLRLGDRVRLKPISLDEFERLGGTCTP